MEPEIVDGHCTLVLELKGPLPAKLVLGVFPLRTNTGLE
jgi:hypothetical protein